MNSKKEMKHYFNLNYFQLFIEWIYRLIVSHLLFWIANIKFWQLFINLKAMLRTIIILFYSKEGEKGISMVFKEQQAAYLANKKGYDYYLSFIVIVLMLDCYLFSMLKSNIAWMFLGFLLMVMFLGLVYLIEMILLQYSLKYSDSTWEIIISLSRKKVALLKAIMLTVCAHLILSLLGVIYYLILSLPLNCFIIIYSLTETDDLSKNTLNQS